MVKLRKIKRQYWPSEIDLEINSIKKVIYALSIGSDIDVSEIKKLLEQLEQKVEIQKLINDMQQESIDDISGEGLANINNRIEIQEQAQEQDEWLEV